MKTATRTSFAGELSAVSEHEGAEATTVEVGSWDAKADCCISGLMALLRRRNGIRICLRILTTGAGGETVS